MDVDVIVVGAGWPGSSPHERDQSRAESRFGRPGERRQSRGQAFWSFGGLFLVDSPEQRRMGVKDLRTGLSDWQGSAAFDRLDDEDVGVPAGAGLCRVRRRGETVLAQRPRHQFPADGRMGRARRSAGRRARQLGPRFHVAWGTGTGVVEPFVNSALRPGPRAGSPASPSPRGRTGPHRRAVTGVRGVVLAPDDAPRGAEQPRSGGRIRVARAGRHRHHRRHRWQPRHRAPLLAGPDGNAASVDDHRVPEYVDGRMLDIAADSGCGWSTGTGCGTTPRASRTGTRSGPGTPSGSCPARRRCGSTPWAGDCRPVPPRLRHLSARCAICAPPRTSPRMTTAGSS